MVEPYGVLGTRSPNRAARRNYFARFAVAVCVLLPAAARGVEPAAPPRTIDYADYATSRRLPPVETPAAAPLSGEAAVTQAGGVPEPYDRYANQPYASQINYWAAQTAPPVDPSAAPGGNRALLSGILNPPEKKTQSVENDAEREGSSDGERSDSASGERRDGEQTYGQAPTNNALQFLRDVDVLLKPGAWQADTGFVYTHFVNDFPFPVLDGGGEIIDVAEGEIRNRLLFTPLAVRYGLTTNVQLFATLPIGYSNTQVSTFGISGSEDTGGLGDLTAGASVHLLEGEQELPDVIGTFGVTAPTGDFNAPVFGVVPGSALGQGFWAVNSQLLFIHRYDPVIVFYGVGYRHLFEREFSGVLFAPGEQINYMMGVGFSINDRVTLSGVFQGFYITDSFANGQDIPGSNMEPLSMRFAATMVRDCRIIEPFVQLGLTDSAPAANFGIVFTFY